ncbi:hypothetical protein CPB85DRAFT_834388 [Mucidula mucida]|nr:hypothetical protein CPB85DRAFT_834388 [Mucidula mucida]
MMEEDSGRIVPTMHQIILNASRPSQKLDLLKNLHVMHIFDMISKLRVSADILQHELAGQAQNTILQPLGWPSKAAVTVKRRRAIDVSRPAWVVEDRVMNFLLSMESPAAIQSRLRAAQIILRPSQEIIDSPAPVKEWLHAFEARARFGDAHVSAVVEELKKRLMQNVYELIPLVLSRTRHYRFRSQISRIHP